MYGLVLDYLDYHDCRSVTTHSYGVGDFYIVSGSSIRINVENIYGTTSYVFPRVPATSLNLGGIMFTATGYAQTTHVDTSVVMAGVGYIGYTGPWGPWHRTEVDIVGTRVNHLIIIGSVSTTAWGLHLSPVGAFMKYSIHHSMRIDYSPVTLN